MKKIIGFAIIFCLSFQFANAQAAGQSSGKRQHRVIVAPTNDQIKTVNTVIKKDTSKPKQNPQVKTDLVNNEQVKMNKNKNGSNPASANVKPKENIQKVKPVNKPTTQNFEVKTARDAASGRSTGKRHYTPGGGGTTGTKQQPQQKEPVTKDTTATQTSKTASKNNGSNPAAVNGNKLNKENIQKVKPENKVSTPNDLATGQSSGKRQHGEVKIISKETKDSFARATTKPQTSKTTSGNTQKTKNNNIKDPFNPGSPDDDVRNPFDTTKKIKAKQPPAIVQPKYDLKNTQVTSIKNNKQKQVNRYQDTVKKIEPQPAKKPVVKPKNR